jgi:acetyltransferase-like isoleucine patch superfamily enzyme
MKKIKPKISYFYTLFMDWMILFRLSRIISDTKHTQTPVKFKHWFQQKIIGRNREVYWPIHPYSEVRGVRRVFAGVETCPGYEKGCYIQAVNPIYIGDYTQIASNVGLISANHNLYDLREQEAGKPIRIGKYCWLGMGVIILPEVELGDFTIVGAGAVVSKSFPEGHCVIAGNPAKIVKHLDKEKCIPHKSKKEYNGFYRSTDEFNKYRSKYLSI